MSELGNEAWEFLFGELKGDVPEVLTDDVLNRLAAAIVTALEAASSTPDGEVVKAWECPQCRCTSYARVEERKPGETKFTPGDSVRCVNCKFVSYLPVISHNAGEIEAGGEVERLKQIISECATATGAMVSPSCTIEFMSLLPAEITASKAKADKRIAELMGERDEARDKALEEALAAVQGERLREPNPADETDVVYMRAIGHAEAAILALKESRL